MGAIKIAGDQWPPLIVAELFKPYEVVIGVHKVHIIKENDLCYTVVFYILADGLIHDVVITHIYHCDVLILVGKVWHNCVCVAVLYNKDVFMLSPFVSISVRAKFPPMNVEYLSFLVLNESSKRVSVCLFSST